MTNAIESMVKQLMNRKPPEDRNTMVVNMSRTMSQYEIAAELGVSRTTVYNILKAHREGKGRNQHCATTHH